MPLSAAQRQFADVYRQTRNLAAATDMVPEVVLPAADAARFYVYGLVDPRDHTLFYIGKGTARRYEAHVVEARNGGATNQRKNERIKAILAAGGEPQVVLFANDLDDEPAYAIEAAMIDALQDCGLLNGRERIFTEPPVREIIPMPPELAEEVRQFRFEERIDSKAEAYRRLIREALDARRSRKKGTPSSAS